MRTVTFCFDTTNLTFNTREVLVQKMHSLLRTCMEQKGTLYRLFMRTALIRSACDPEPDAFISEDDFRNAEFISHFTDAFALLEMRNAVTEGMQDDEECIAFIFEDQAMDIPEAEIPADVYMISLAEDGWPERTERLLSGFLDTGTYDRQLAGAEDIYARGRYMVHNHRTKIELMTGIELLKLAAFRAFMTKASKELLFAYEHFFTDRSGLQDDILRAAEHIVFSPETDTDECIRICRMAENLCGPAPAARMLKRLYEERNVSGEEKALIVSLANTCVPDTFEPPEALDAAFMHREIYEASAWLYSYFDEKADDSHFFWLTVPIAAQIREKYTRDNRPYDDWLKRVKNSRSPFREEILEYYSEKEKEEYTRRKLLGLRYEADMKSLKALLSGEEDDAV